MRRAEPIVGATDHVSDGAGGCSRCGAAISKDCRLPAQTPFTLYEAGKRLVWLRGPTEAPWDAPWGRAGLLRFVFGPAPVSEPEQCS